MSTPICPSHSDLRSRTIYILAHCSDLSSRARVGAPQRRYRVPRVNRPLLVKTTLTTYSLSRSDVRLDTTLRQGDVNSTFTRARVVVSSRAISILGADAGFTIRDFATIYVLGQRFCVLSIHMPLTNNLRLSLGQLTANGEANQEENLLVGFGGAATTAG
jgi:hypothetical protein